jgi:hypothetical protein
MSKMFHDLMKGLDEVEAYLSGKGVGHRVHMPEAAMQAVGEDREDMRVSRSRMKEKSKPLAKVKASLVASGRLRG